MNQDTPELPIVAKLMLERSNDFGCEVLGKHVNPDGPEAATLIAEFAEIAAALAEAADRVERRAETWGKVPPGDGYTVAISLGKCRRARAALHRAQSC